LRQGISRLRRIVAFEDGPLDLIDAASESTPDARASLPNGILGTTGALSDLTLGRFGKFLRTISEHAKPSQCLSPLFLYGVG